MKSFSEAIKALKEGLMVARKVWEHEDKFIFMQVPSVINKEIVPKMQSLPDSVKNKFEKRFNDSNAQIDAIYYGNQIAIVNSSNLISGYSPSAEDILAEDWEIVE